MGYYANFEFYIANDTKVNPKRVKNLEALFSDKDNNNLYGFRDVVLEIDKNNNLININLSEYYSKFYDSELFANELSNCLTSGYVKLLFHGEDGGAWGFVVKPNQVTNLYKIWLTEEEFDKIRELNILKEEYYD